jgi:hypothetical protein
VQGYRDDGVVLRTQKLGEADRIITLWGSEMRFGVSCGQLRSDVVLVGESAEDPFPVDPVLGEVDWLGWQVSA